jgi:hypothetical protein
MDDETVIGELLIKVVIIGFWLWSICWLILIYLSKIGWFGTFRNSEPFMWY